MLDSQLFFCLGNNIRRQKHEGFNSCVLPLLLCFKTMEFRGRFVLAKQQFEFLQPNFIPPFCPGIHSVPLPPLLPLPPCPPPPPSPNVIMHDESDDSAVSKEAKRVTIKVVMAIMACMIVAIFVLGFILMIMKRRRDRRLRRSRNIGPIIFGTQEDFLDGDQGPQLDHHIWYINTVGLDQSVIDSISAFKYKKDEALIEGTECSVCLGEFQEDESLRLLPKCSHAFHITCIDTWLRSHKNCPLCRAPIVNANFVGQVGVSDPSSSGSASRVESQIENSEISGLSTEVAVEDGTGEVRNGDGSGSELRIEDEIDGGNHSKVNLNNSIWRDHSRVQSDLVDNSQAFDAAIQPIRRSVSLDYSSASAIYSAVANAMNGEIQESENHQLQQKNSKSKSAAKRGSGGSMSFRKLMKSSSIGFSLQKGPVSMKRSFSSSSGKCSSSRNSRSQNSILPL